MEIKTDERLNQQLKKKVQELRSSINKGKDSTRFLKIPCDDSPRYIVRDIKTGKETKVPLFALSNVMDALCDLFEDDGKKGGK